MNDLNKIREKNNYIRWAQHYWEPLFDLFQIFKKNEFKDYNDNEVIKEIQFKDFCYFVYTYSSKSLIKYEY